MDERFRKELLDWCLAFRCILYWVVKVRGELAVSSLRYDETE